MRAYGSISPPVLVIVLGAPGAGKTTLARRIAAEIGWPLLVRDDIKEILFDTLGWSDRQWSRKLGGASWRMRCPKGHGSRPGGGLCALRNYAGWRWASPSR